MQAVLAGLSGNAGGWFDLGQDASQKNPQNIDNFRKENFFLKGKKNVWSFPKREKHPGAGRICDLRLAMSSVRDNGDRWEFLGIFFSSPRFANG